MTTIGCREWMCVISAAIGLTMIFWGPLWLGGGLFGGDIYTYCLPQKGFLVDRFSAGEFPLWNYWVGHGYPLVGESQTGLFYPFHLFFYRLFDVNIAYNANQILHYIFGFVFTWLYARRMGLGAWAAGLTGLIYTYAWFPPRISLEWAIIGGAWLPLALWSAESYLLLRKKRFLLLLSGSLAMQMLPGHFNLAFITQLVLALYLPTRLWLFKDGLPSRNPADSRRLLLGVSIAIVLAFALSAVQLGPAWELKQLSQRASGASDSFEPGDGYIPPIYWSQIVFPMYWYGADIHTQEISNDGHNYATGPISAHLYFGLITLLLLGHGTFSRIYFENRRWWLWFSLGIAAFLYTSGWFVPIMSRLPGFGYFIGPGRYGIITSLAVALLAGAALQHLATTKPARNSVIRAMGAIVIFAVLIIDLLFVARVQTMVTLVPYSFVDFVEKSPIQRILKANDQPVRLLAGGANTPNLLGVASTPTYLGIGPRQYYDPQYMMPEPFRFSFAENPTDEQIDWLRRGGVTHVLGFVSLEGRGWPVDRLWSGVDPFLSRVWFLDERQPLYLYSLRGSRGRVAWLQPGSKKSARVTEYRANRIAIVASSTLGGDLVLTDMTYPGWTVEVDGKLMEPIVIEGMYRGVHLDAGEHQVVWSYWSPYQTAGAITSGMAILLVLILFLVTCKRRLAQQSVEKGV